VTAPERQHRRPRPGAAQAGATHRLRVVPSLVVCGIDIAEHGGGLRCSGADKFADMFHANPLYWRQTMQWTTPAFTDLRFGFEITMYIANR